MRTRKLFATAATGALLMALAVAPASADDVDVTFTVDAGLLTLNSVSATKTIDDAGANPAYSLTGTNAVSGSMPTVTLTDGRGLLTTWKVEVVGTDWTDGSGNSVAASNGHVYFDVANLTELQGALTSTLSGMTIAGGEYNVGTADLGTKYTLLNGSTTNLNLLGENPSVEFTPVIDVSIPAGTVPGTYTNKVTYSAS